jgi:hypothetical protein
MMENGGGASKARVGVVFLAAGSAFTAMSENTRRNAMAGGIDLVGLFPRYVNIRPRTDHTICGYMGRSAVATNQPSSNLRRCTIVLVGVADTNDWNKGLWLFEGGDIYAAADIVERGIALRSATKVKIVSVWNITYYKDVDT